MSSFSVERSLLDIRPITIAVVSDVRVTRDGVSRVLSHEFSVSCSVRSISEAAIQDVLPFDVIVIDASTVSVEEVGASSMNLRGKLAVFGLKLDNRYEALAWIAAGARVCLECDARTAELIDAVHAAAEGRVWCHSAFMEAVVCEAPRLANLRAPDDGRDQLTPRELEVARLVRRRLTNKQICDTLGIELSTVKNHVHNILVKLKLNRRRDIASRNPESNSQVSDAHTSNSGAVGATDAPMTTGESAQ